MSTCNQLDLQTLRFQPVMLKKFLITHSYMASNGSCWMDYFKNHLLEVGLA